MQKIDVSKLNDDEELELYEKFVASVLERIDCLYTEQLLYMLQKEFYPRVSYAKADRVLSKAQRDGILMMTTDGFCITKAKYLWLSGDKFFDDLLQGQVEKVDGDKIHLEEKIKDEIPTIDCMSIVADMMPGSDQFTLNTEPPWLVQFIMPADDHHQARVFQVTKFIAGEENQDGIFMAQLPVEKTPQNQEFLRRIVVLDRAEARGMVPHGCGVSMIVALDDSDKGYELLETFEINESWKKTGKSIQQKQKEAEALKKKIEKAKANNQ